MWMRDFQFAQNDIVAFKISFFCFVFQARQRGHFMNERESSFDTFSSGSHYSSSSIDSRPITPPHVPAQLPSFVKVICSSLCHSVFGIYYFSSICFCLNHPLPHTYFVLFQKCSAFFSYFMNVQNYWMQTLINMLEVWKQISKVIVGIPNINSHICILIHDPLLTFADDLWPGWVV